MELIDTSTPSDILNLTKTIRAPLHTVERSYCAAAQLSSSQQACSDSLSETRSSLETTIKRQAYSHTWFKRKRALV